jgi:hypothetical protein
LFHIVIRIAIIVAAITLFVSVFVGFLFVARVARFVRLSLFRGLNGSNRFFQNFPALFLDGRNGSLDVGVLKTLVVIDAFEDVLVKPNLYKNMKNGS